MATVVEGALRNQLVERRRKLQAFARDDRTSYLQDLLHEVDEALARLDTGSFGRCEVCHDPIEADRLMADPLCRVCLDDLPKDELRRLEHDLEMAAQIQAALLPKPDLCFDGWEIHAHYEAVGPVSGDYYDVIRSAARDGESLFLFGDVSGKGVAASLLMASLQAIFRSLIASGLPLQELLTRGNRLFCETSGPSSFATLVCGRLSPSGALELANAGHYPPLLLRGSRVESLPATGLPVGLFCSAEYASHSVQLAPGDLLLLYTDGLSEARDDKGEEYGLARIMAVLEHGHGRSAQGVTRALIDDLAGFQRGTRRADDLTVMALARPAGA